VRRILLTLVALCGALLALPSAASSQPSEISVTCDETGAYLGRLYQMVLGRSADPEGLAYWVSQRRRGMSGEDIAFWMTQSREFQRRYAAMDDPAFINALYRNVLNRPAEPAGMQYWFAQLGDVGRHGVISSMAQTPELVAALPYNTSSMCLLARWHGLEETVPGIAVGRSPSGATVTVVADRRLVTLRAVDGAPTHASAIDGDVALNANWFTAAGPIGPIVSDGRRSGSADTIERGQILVHRPECRDRGDHLEHVWMGEVREPDGCVITAVSGVSLVHKGQRADTYPGITLTSGYTNVVSSHSFLGFGPDVIVMVASTEMNASRLADHALSLGVLEGVMLDGGRSTQIATPTAGLTTTEKVPAFAVLDSLAP
jgi:hypothetical protein